MESLLDLDVEEMKRKTSRSNRLPRHGRNQMAFDLGLSPEYFDNASVVDAFVHELNSTFDLILIMERFPESLVLLRRALCWSVHDMIAFPMNQLLQGKPKTKVNEKLTALNKADFQIYHTFRRKFDEAVLALGDELQDELEALSCATEAWREECGLQRIKGANLIRPVRPYGRTWGYMVSPKHHHSMDICYLFATAELPFLKLLQARQTIRVTKAGLSQ